MSQHGGEKETDLLRVAAAPLRQGQKGVGKAQVVIDLDEQVRQTNGAHVRGQPVFQVVQPRLRLSIQLLGDVGGEVPAVLVHCGVTVARRRLEEQVVSLVQPLREVYRNVPRLDRETGTLEEGFAA